MRKSVVYSPILVYTENSKTRKRMRMVWDEPKHQANLAKQGLDFADLTVEFFLNAIVVPAKGGRHAAIVRLADETVTTIFATLGSEGDSVVSTRRASKKERTRHAQDV